MFFPGKIASKLLIWLTAVAMPFQAGWAAYCGCHSAQEPAAGAVSRLAEPRSCCRAAIPEATRSEGCVPRQKCCIKRPVPGRGGGCHCGPICPCVRHDEVPTEPAAPAPDNGRGQSLVELAVAPFAAIFSPDASRSGHDLAAEARSAFHLPGAQVCVILCRLTL
jgi:hypothetical protein